MPSASRGSVGTASRALGPEQHAGVAHRRREPPRRRRGRRRARARPGRGARPSSSAAIVDVVRSAGCSCACLQLHELHGPLDVREPAVAELEVRLAVGAARQPLGLHPRLEGADLAHLAVVEPARGPAHRRDEREEALAELGVTGHRRRPQQRLGLPHERPAVVVLAVRLERAHQRARSCPRVAATASTSRFGVGAAQPEQPDQLLDDLERLRLGLALVGALDRVVHEEHVGVASRSPARRPRAGPSRRRAPG